MGSAGSRDKSRQPDQRSTRKPRRPAGPEAGLEGEATTAQGIQADHLGQAGLRDAIARSNGESRAGLMLSLQRSYGNSAVASFLQRQPAGTEPAGGGSATSSADQPMLRAGSAGAAVKQLQAILNTLGARPALGVDGQFGPATHGAVVAFQRQNNLAPDGIVGPMTWGTLRGAQPTFTEEPSEGGLGPSAPEGAKVGSETPEEESNALAVLGLKLIDADKYAEALPHLLRIYSLPELPYPNRNFALYHIAVCYQKLGQKEQAISSWEELLVFPEIDDRDRTLALERLRELRTGEEYKRSGEIQPSTPQEQAAADATAVAEINAGYACGQSGDDAGLLDHSQNAYGLRHASFHYRLAATTYAGLALRGLKQFDSALDMFQEALGFPENAFNQPIGNAYPVSRESVLNAMRDTRAGHAGPRPEQPAMSDEEQQALFDQATKEARAGQYAAALAMYERVYSATDNLSRRANTSRNMGRCHQLLGNFDRAVSIYMEVAGYPGLSEDDKAVIQERIRQARMHEVGLRVTAGQPEAGAEAGTPQLLFRGEVYFETGSTTMNYLGAITTENFSAALNGRKRSEPQLDIFVMVIGHSSARWRSAAGDGQRHELNQQLAVDRARVVEADLRAQVLPATTTSFFTDGTGDQLTEPLGTGPDDNTWFFRSVTIVAKGVTLGQG